jgi:drug/metabolite transporter (DMT)-like permease
MSSSPRHAILYLKLILTAVFWGGTFIAGRIVVREVAPFSAAFLRFVVASVILFGFIFKTQKRLPPVGWKQLLAVTALGLTGVFAYNAFFFSGLKTVTASRASLIITSNPAFIALFAALFFGDRLSLLKLLGIALSISGAVIVVSKGHPLQVLEGNLGLGEFCIFGCVASWVAYSLIGKVTLTRLSPLVSVTYACVVGTAFLAPPAFSEGLYSNLPHYSGAVWLSIIYLGLFGTALGFIWYYEGIQTIGPSRAGVFINLVPLSALIMAFFILNETLDASILMGAIFVFAGVYLTNRP